MAFNITKQVQRIKAAKVVLPANLWQLPVQYRNKLVVEHMRALGQLTSAQAKSYKNANILPPNTPSVVYVNVAYWLSLEKDGWGPVSTPSAVVEQLLEDWLGLGDSWYESYEVSTNKVDAITKYMPFVQLDVPYDLNDDDRFLAGYCCEDCSGPSKRYAAKNRVKFVEETIVDKFKKLEIV
jgi:hypothetical protein